MIRLIETGIRGLDEVLGGGFPHQNTVLVSGPPGTGKTILGMQFVLSGIQLRNEPGVILTFEQFPEMIYRDAHALGWDFRDLERRGVLRVIHTSPQTYFQEMRAPGNLIERAIREIKAKRCFVDGFLLATHGAGGERDLEVRQLFDSLRREGLSVVASKEKPADESNGVSYESFLGDTIICLTYEAERQQRIRRLEVLKSRGQKFIGGQHSFAIRETDGIIVYPRFKAPVERAEVAPLTERALTGVAPLDAMTSGGFPVGSTTLVAGLPGVGKSIFGLHFLAAGAAAGERGLLISLDEVPGQLQRQGDVFGLGIGKAVEQGTLVLRHLSLAELEVNRSLHEIRNLVTVGKVRRLVIDSISTFEAGLDAISFRDYLVSLLELLRCFGVTTYLISELSDFGTLSCVTGHGTSYLVDNILLLRYLEHRGEIRRVLGLVKMRGSDHDRRVREYRIGTAGAQILDLVGERFEGPIPYEDYQNLMLGTAQRIAMRPAAPPLP